MSEQMDHAPGISIDFEALAFGVLHRWKIVVATTLAGVLWAIFELHGAPYIYSTKLVVTPVNSSGNDNTPNRLAALGGLATLAGLTVPANQSATEFRLFVENIHSRVIADTMAKNDALMKHLFANQWDAQSNNWREPPADFSRRSLNAVRKFLGLPVPPWTPPGGAQMQQFIAAKVQVIQDPKINYLATLEFDSASPKFAASFLSQLAFAADDNLRQRALSRTRQYIDYLTTQLNHVTVAEHREAIMNSLSLQEQNAMAANSAAPYAAEIFDGPAYAPQPVSPNAKSVFARYIALGAAIGAIIALLLYAREAGLIRQLLERFSLHRKH